MQNTYIHNTAMTANTPFFTAIPGTNFPTSTFRVNVVLQAATSPVLSVVRTNAAGGGGSVTENLNSGSGLVSNASYVFDILVVAGDTITLQSNQNGTILTFVLREVGQ
jgi:hypothetical protein